jgi:hypothetical protein
VTSCLLWNWLVLIHPTMRLCCLLFPWSSSWVPVSWFCALIYTFLSPSGESLQQLADTKLFPGVPLMSWLFLSSMAQPCSLISNPRVHTLQTQTK